MQPEMTKTTWATSSFVSFLKRVERQREQPGQRLRGERGVLCWGATRVGERGVRAVQGHGGPEVRGRRDGLNLGFRWATPVMAVWEPSLREAGLEEVGARSGTQKCPVPSALTPWLPCELSIFPVLSSSLNPPSLLPAPSAAADREWDYISITSCFFLSHVPCALG